MPAVKEPSFPDRGFDTRDYGAIGDGVAMNTKAIADAIDACNAAGGGRVIIPAGKWLTGPIHLKSNVNLRLEKDAEVHFSTNYSDYLPVVFTRFEGTECYNYSPLIYAKDCNNIAVTGPGKLDGHGQAWWHWFDLQDDANKRLLKMERDSVPVSERIFGIENGLRPSFLQPVNCRNVLLEDFTITNGPMWTIHPLYCEDTIIRNVSMITEGHNGDGIDPDSCRNMIIENCCFSTEDDAVAIKSGRDSDGWRVAKPSENIIIRNCKSQGGTWGGISIGSEISGDARNIFIHNCDFDGPNMGFFLKSRIGRGGIMENVWIQDIKINQVRNEVAYVTMYYWCGETPVSKKLPAFRNIHFKNLTCKKAKDAMKIEGLPEKFIENMSLENIEISAENGLTINNVKNLRLTNVNINPGKGPAILLKDARNVTILPEAQVSK